MTPDSKQQERLPYEPELRSIPLCKKMVPSPYYIHKDRCDFCVEIYCANWVRETRKCIDCDPSAGSTYEVTEAHCKFDEVKL